jgi:hypothetical protein
MKMALACVLAWSTTAHAGLDCPEKDEGVKQIEKFARAKFTSDDLSSAWLCVELAGKYKERIEKACEKIIDRDGAASPCWRLSAAVGVAKAGKHDILAWTLAQKEDPFDYGGAFLYKFDLLARIGDPSGAAWIVQTWKDTIPRADEKQKQKKAYAMQAWSGWRQRAAAALGTFGGKDDATFLEEQAKATKDSYVAKACRDAAAAITKRLAKP